MAEDDAMDEHPLITVEDQAADWIVRQDGEYLSPGEQMDFATWIAVPAHRAAYDRQQALWRRYQQLGARQAVAVSPVYRPRRGKNRARALPARRRWVASAIAASLALIFAGYIGDWPTRLRADYLTDAGERRTVVLADGSRIQLDGSSAITIDLVGDRRRVRLLQGAAAIEVAPDPNRPFAVETDEGRVTALGTAFALRQNENGSDLTVLEHSVAVQTSGGRSAIIREGQGARFTSGELSGPTAVDTRVATAWTKGRLIVFDRPLSEVVSAIGRQRHGYWTVSGEAATMRINGATTWTIPWVPSTRSSAR